jgi:hypothetical protein
MSLGPNAPWERRLASLPACAALTAKIVQIVFGHVRADLWKLDHVVDPGVGISNAVRALTSAAPRRDDRPDGSPSRWWPLRPGSPPRARPVGTFGSRGVPDRSADGGLDEF